MKADISRDSFDPADNFQRVLLQQGRVRVDADWNEQISILLNQLRLLSRGIAGPYSGPKDTAGFEVVGGADTDATKEQFRQKHGIEGEPPEKDFWIGPGSYYIDGVVTQNHAVRTYKAQPFFSPSAELTGFNLVFLDVWERHVVSLQSDGIADPALRGIETSHRSQLVWQVRVQLFTQGGNTFKVNSAGDTLTVSHDGDHTLAFSNAHQTGQEAAEALDEVTKFFAAFLAAKSLTHAGRGRLIVTINPPEQSDRQEGTPGYRGTDNRLYRVEIQQGGQLTEDQDASVTFKWSRDNGSVVFPVAEVNGDVVTVGSVPGDSSRLPDVGSFVELLDEHYVLTSHHSDDPNPAPRRLYEVRDVTQNGENYRVRVDPAPDPKPAGASPAEQYNILRVWDHQPPKNGNLVEGGIPVPRLRKGSDAESVPLEHGLYVRFLSGAYRTGDYWLIPARAGLSRQPWEDTGGNSKEMEPQSVEHHFAPLAVIEVADDKVDRKRDLRMTFESELKVIT